MADNKHKPLEVLFKKNSDENKEGRDGKKAKKHKRHQSDLSDVNVDSLGQEQQHMHSTGEVSAGPATPEELAMPLPEHGDNQDGTKAKPKKKSRLKRISFGRKKKTDTKRESASSLVESETSSSLEAGAMVSEVDVKSDEENRAGTRNAGPSAGDLGFHLFHENVCAADANSLVSNASSLTVVTPLGSKATSPLLSQETTESQESDFKNQSNQAEEIEMNEIGDEFYSLPDDEEVCPQIEIPPDTDIAEGIPRPSDLSAESKEKETIAETMYAILHHLKAVAFGDDRCGHVSEVTSETYKLGVIALDQSFAKFEGLFNFFLNQAEETTRKIVMYFLASLIKKYPHCFKVCKVKRKKRKSALKPTATATQPAQKDTVS